MPEIIKNGPPPEIHYGERRVRALDVAILRAGLAVPEVAHLSAIPEHRVRAIISGDEASPSERATLMRVLPDWNGSDEGGKR